MRWLGLVVCLVSITVLADGQGGSITRATSLKSFQGKEQPDFKWVVADNKNESDPTIHITDSGENTVRMMLRYCPQWWDGDPATKDKDRQRAEVKGLGPHQKNGDTFEYKSTWRSSPNMVGSGHFCHIFQLKATDGDEGAPLVTMSILGGTSSADVDYWSGDARNSTPVRKFPWKPGEWLTVAIRIKTSAAGDGFVAASINGDPFQGVHDVPVFRPKADDYRPKWGLYRGISENLPVGESWIEHKDVSATKM